MKHPVTLWLWALLVLLAGTFEARANLSDYRFDYSSFGEWIEPNLSIPLLGAGNDDATSPATEIGFPFVFDGTTYTQFSVSSNGLIGLGSRPVSPCWVNQLTTPSGLCDGVGGYDFTLANTPHIAPFWDDLRVPDLANDGFEGQISYGISGTAPNRILVITFRDVETDYFGFNYSTFQVRLYETSNAIEFYYDFLNSNYFFGDGASIGLAASSTNFLSVYPDFGSASTSSSEANDSYFPSDPTMSSGTLYTFQPCEILFTGDEAEGGTAGMAENDVLLAGKQTMVYTYATYFPFSMTTPEACSTRTVTATITGPHAADYTFSPSEFTVFAGNEPMTAMIEFRPTGVGVRNARLQLTDDRGNTRTFNLAAEGLPRIMYTGNIAEGGTPGMNNGDVLMTNIHVRRGESGDFQPFMLTNILEQGEAPNAEVTYWIRGTSRGQYVITPPNASLGNGESHTPTIRFAPTSIGPVLDSLFVMVDGETRVFRLLAISDGVGAELSIGNELVEDGELLFVNRFSCAGAELITLPLTVRNVGNQPFQITGADFFATDSVYGQGVPRYPLLWQSNETPVRLYDYIITEAPPSLPITPSQASFPMTIEVGATRTLYITFVGQEPGKRFARAFVYTNAENFAAANPYGEVVEGLLTMDLFGRGLGARLSDRPEGKLPMSVQFGEHRIGEQVTQFLTLMNNGVCPLRISLPLMEIVAGDVDEFEIVTKPSSNVDPATGDLVLAPGASDRVELRFIATQRGSRRAGLRLVTNDSSIHIPGITERGVFYVDLFGQGKADLYAESVDLGQALIGGDAAEHKHGIIRVRNTQDRPVTITGIAIEGPDAADFVEDPLEPWPTLPFTLSSGDPIELGVKFAPGSGGTPGPREATLKLTLSNGETLVATVRGMAGTRTIAVGPPVLNFLVSPGGQARKSVTIGNSGTMPLKITGWAVGNPDFTLGTLERTELAPGQFEQLEITFTPQGAGTSTDQLVVRSNGTNGAQNVALNGTASTKRRRDDASSSTMRLPETGGEIVDAAEEFSVSGVTGTTEMEGMALLQSVPNPGRDVVEIGWTLPQRSEMKLELYDASGRMVRTLETGIAAAGEHRVRVDVSALVPGVYFYRLTAGSASLSRSLTVVR